MKHYELLCVLPGTLGEDEVQPLVNEVKTVLTDSGAANIASEDRGKTRLAYPINHIRYGYFTLFTFEGEPTVVPQAQAKLRLMTNVLRAMVNEFNPELRKEKDAILAKLARERAENEKARAGAPVVEEAEETKPAVKAAPVDAPAAEAEEAKPAKKSKKASTDKPTEEDMNVIEEKLDKVLDSSLEV